MADRQKKMAAAMAAVSAYLQMEEQAAAAAATRPSPLPAAQQTPSCWSLSGRQDMMTMRRLVQLRTFATHR